MAFLFNPRAFDMAIVLMFLGAAIRWGFAGDWARAGYWTSAAVLNICISMMGAK